MQRTLATEWATTVIAELAKAARDEMQQLAGEFRTLARASGVATPALNVLSTYLDPSVEPIPAGRARIVLEWQGLWTLAAIVGLGLGFVAWRRAKKGRRQG